MELVTQSMQGILCRCHVMCAAPDIGWVSLPPEDALPSLTSGVQIVPSISESIFPSRGLRPSKMAYCRHKITLSTFPLLNYQLILGSDSRTVPRIRNTGDNSCLWRVYHFGPYDKQTYDSQYQEGLKRKLKLKQNKNISENVQMFDSVSSDGRRC